MCVLLCSLGEKKGKTDQNENEQAAKELRWMTDSYRCSDVILRTLEFHSWQKSTVLKLRTQVFY